jgi:hypothetical protein
MPPKSNKRAPERLSPLLRRVLTLAALLIGCAVVYGIILARIDFSKGETELGAPISQARVNLYLQPIQIDTANESMQVRDQRSALVGREGNDCRS